MALDESTLREIIRSEMHHESQTMREDIADIKELLTGNGDPSKGIIVRVDRLEQKGESTTWWTRAALGGVVGSIITAIWSAISTK